MAAAGGMGWIIGVGNLKGGTGKSTLAVNAACRLAAVERPTLLLDVDPQGTAGAWLNGTGPLPPGLSVAPAPVDDMPEVWANTVLQKAADKAYLILDLPPQLGPGFEAALGVVDALLVPVTPSAIDLRATALTLKAIERVRQRRGGRPACLLVPNRVDQRTAVGRTVQRALGDLGFRVTPPIAQRSQHAAAFAAQRWIGAHAPSSAAFRELAAVVSELERLLLTCPASERRPGEMSELLLTRAKLAAARGTVADIEDEDATPAGFRPGNLLASLLQGLGLRRSQPSA